MNENEENILWVSFANSVVNVVVSTAYTCYICTSYHIVNINSEMIYLFLIANGIFVNITISFYRT